MICTACNDEIPESEIRWDGDYAYCEDCFNERFDHCSRCDETISRDNTNYDDDGNPYCDNCYEQEHDDDAPDNPDVNESDREFIIQISRNWLQGKVEYKKLISINDKDYHLKAIKDKVGLVENPIYIFGLADRDEFQISASQNIIEDVKEALLLSGVQTIVNEGIGCNRLGISLSLRQNNLSQIVNLIKQITAEPVQQ